MKENESRTVNPSAYTTPASVFNTLAVDIDLNTLSEHKSEPTNVEKELPLRTVILPAAELLKLDPIASDKAKIENDTHPSSQPSSVPLTDPTSMQQAMNSTPCEFVASSQHQDPTMHYAYHYDVNAQAQNAGLAAKHFQSMPQNQQQLNNNFIYSSSMQNQQFIPSNMNFFHQNASSSLPPQQSDGQKSLSLERSSALGYVSRMSSLERIQNAQKAVRSNSLTRQLSAGPETYSLNSRSASFERNNGPIAQQQPQYGCRANSLERNQQMQGAGQRGGSLERNQSIASTYDLMKNRSYRGGSLERNQQAMLTANRAGSLERNQQFSMGGYRNQMKPPDAEPFQEEIYDFGGANVKSCASIALSKSMSKGMNPSGVSTSHHLPIAQSQNPQSNQIPQSQNYHHYPLSPQQMYASQIYTQMHPSRIWPAGGSQHQPQQQNTLRSLPPTAQNQSSFSQGSSVKLQMNQQHQQQQPINVQTNPHLLTQSSASVQVCPPIYQNVFC